MEEVTINISKDFTKTPGARYRTDGPFSGEEFREVLLEKHFMNPVDNYKINIILDGVAGFPSSFLDESFGHIARKYGIERSLNRFNFISEEDDLLIAEIIETIKEEYIQNCKKTEE